MGDEGQEHTGVYLAIAGKGGGGKVVRVEEPLPSLCCPPLLSLPPTQATCVLLLLQASGLVGGLRRNKGEISMDLC